MNRVITMFYELKDAKTGEILEQNMTNGGVSFLSGKNQILQKLEEEALKLEVGKEAIIRIDCKDGLGDYDNNAIQIVPKEQFVGIDLKEGMELFGEGEDGSTARVIVKSIGENEVTIDFNHPYAGKDLEFKVQIIENREATEDEIATGVVVGSHTCGCHGHDHHHDGGGCCGGAHHDEDGGGCCGRHH